MTDKVAKAETATPVGSDVRAKRRKQQSHKKAAMNGLMFLAGFAMILMIMDYVVPGAVDATQIMTRITGVLALLLVLHVLILRHLTSPYYVAHIVANGIICVLCFNDLISIATDTVNTLRITKADTWALDICNALHVYHVAAYTDLRFVDHLHHIIMVFLCMPLFYTAGYGPLANYNMFFVSGLPGGLDYVMLALVRSKKLKKLVEKKWNTSINVWMRSPFLLGSVFFSHVQVMLNWDEYSSVQVWCHFICQVIQFWNAMYFTESVVGDYYRLSLQKGKIALYHDLSYVPPTHNTSETHSHLMNISCRRHAHDSLFDFNYTAFTPQSHNPTRAIFCARITLTRHLPTPSHSHHTISTPHHSDSEEEEVEGGVAITERFMKRSSSYVTGESEDPVAAASAAEEQERLSSVQPNRGNAKSRGKKNQ